MTYNYDPSQRAALLNMQNYSHDRQDNPNSKLHLRATRTRNLVIAHDYFTQLGGAERVALTLADGLNADHIVTAAVSEGNTFNAIEKFKIRHLRFVSFLAQKIGDVRKLMPIFPIVWSLMDPIEADVVICSSSGWSHAIRCQSTAVKIVYCHNPARWLYQTDDYLIGKSLSAKIALKFLRPALIWWDRKAARSADLYIANSTSVANRINSCYGINPTVIHPPIGLSTDGLQMEIPELENYFLSIGRSRGYKRQEPLIDAFSKMPDEKLVIAGGEKQKNLPDNVVSLGRVEDSQLRWLYANATALVSVSREDFGLTPVEANSFGTPSLVLKAGGFLDSTLEDVSGKFILDDSPEEIIKAVKKFPRSWNKDIIIDHSKKFTAEKFLEEMEDAIILANA